MRWFCILLFLLVTQAASAAPFVTPRDPQCVAFSPNGSLAALGFSGQANGEFPPRPHPDVRKCGCVQIHDVATGKRLRRIETFGDLIDLRFSPDGKYLASARVFATSEGLELDEVRVWTVVDGKLAATFDRCHGFDFEPNSSRIIVLGRKKCAEFDLASGKRLRSLDELENAVAARWLGESRLVGIVRTGDKEEEYALRLVDAKSGERVNQSASFKEPMYSLAVSPEDRLLATGFPGGGVVIWDAAELKPLAKLSTGNRGIARPFFSPDGELLAAGDQASGDVVIWKLSSGQELYRYTFDKGGFKPHYPRAESAVHRPERDPARFVFSPDGQAFMVGAYSGIVRLVSTGQDIRRFGE